MVALDNRGVTIDNRVLNRRATELRPRYSALVKLEVLNSVFGIDNPDQNCTVRGCVI